jgi:hypothetical protein
MYKRLAMHDMFEALAKSKDRGTGDDKWKENLRRSRERYRDAFDTDRSQSWALVQDVVLSFVLIDDIDDSALDVIEKQSDLARQLCERDRGQTQRDARAWAVGGLIELTLIDVGIQLMKSPLKPSVKKHIENNATQALDGLAEEFTRCLLPKHDWECVSLTRQLERYYWWFQEKFQHPLGNQRNVLFGLISRIQERLPQYE